MTGAEHYAEAERLLMSVREKLAEIEQAPPTIPSTPRAIPPVTSAVIDLAQVHATLALVAFQQESACPHGLTGVCMYCLRDAIRDGIRS